MLNINANVENLIIPGGAVTPAIKDTTGFAPPPVLFSLRNAAAFSSSLPPISPIRILPFV